MLCTFLFTSWRPNYVTIFIEKEKDAAKFSFLLLIFFPQKMTKNIIYLLNKDLFKTASKIILWCQKVYSSTLGTKNWIFVVRFSVKIHNSLMDEIVPKSSDFLLLLTLVWDSPPNRHHSMLRQNVIVQNWNMANSLKFHLRAPYLTI